MSLQLLDVLALRGEKEPLCFHVWHTLKPSVHSGATFRYGLA